jgi:hypothetical protein
MKTPRLTLLALAALGAWSCASAQQSPAPEAVQWPKGPCEFSETDPLPAAEKCKQLAEAGDADAMYQLWVMLLAFAPPDPRLQTREELQKWKPIGDKFSGSKWLDAAAEKGNQAAIQLKCDMGKEPAAPDDLRKDGPKWCARVVKSTAKRTP